MAICYMEQKREWNRLTIAAFDHPFYDKKAHRLSEQEAERMIRSRDLPDGKTVIAEICRKLEIEMPADSTEERKELINPVVWMRGRRWIAAAAIALLLLCFFTLTKPGIAIAKELSSVIVEWITGQFGARNVEPENVASIDFTTLPAEYEDIHAVARATGRTLMELDDPSYVSEPIQVILQESDVLIVLTKYINEDKQIILIQKIYNAGTNWGASINFVEAEERMVSDLLFYVGSTTDGTTSAVAYDSGYEISLKGKDISIQEMIHLLESFEKIEP